tara:strand:+ start:3285 stop:3827 length:543 start_codon:yes stop_codon:yes gene_type:complete
MNENLNVLSHRIIYSSWDFQQALSALTFLCEECEFDEKYSKIELRRFRCFETTVIVSFARPFKVGRGKSPLELSEIGFQFTEDEEKLKNKLLRLRDKVVSHSDEEEMVYRTYSFSIFDDSDIRIPRALFQEGLYLRQEEYREIEKLLHKLMHAILKFKFDFVQKHPELFNQVKIAKSTDG